MNDDKTTSTIVKIGAEIGVASDGTWGVYCKEQPFTGAGDTPQEAKDDMLEQMQFYKETMKGLGMKYPAFLDSEFEVDYNNSKHIKKMLEGQGLEVVSLKSRGPAFFIREFFKRGGLIAGVIFALIFYILQYSFY